MGYISDVRIITTNKGFEKMRESVNSKLSNTDYNLLKEVCIGTFQQGERYTVVGWNCIKWYNEYKEVAAIEEALAELDDAEIPYKFARLGEEFGDISFRDGMGEDWDMPDLYPVQYIPEVDDSEL